MNIVSRGMANQFILTLAILACCSSLCCISTAWADIDEGAAWAEVDDGKQAAINTSWARAAFESDLPAPFGKTVITFQLPSKTDGAAAPISVEIFTLGKTFKLSPQVLENAIVPHYDTLGISLPGETGNSDGVLLINFAYGPDMRTHKHSVIIHIHINGEMQVIHSRPRQQ